MRDRRYNCQLLQLIFQHPNGQHVERENSEHDGCNSRIREQDSKSAHKYDPFARGELTECESGKSLLFLRLGQVHCLCHIVGGRRRCTLSVSPRPLLVGIVRRENQTGAYDRQQLGMRVYEVNVDTQALVDDLLKHGSRQLKWQVLTAL